MTTNAARNWINIAIGVGLLPLLFWLWTVAPLAFDHDALLPWVAAAIPGMGIALGFLSDIFDGVMARRLGIATATLRRLDSVADAPFYVAAAQSRSGTSGLRYSGSTSGLSPC